VKLERDFDISKKSSEASIKVDTKFSDLKDLKVECKLTEASAASAKLNYKVPLDNKHILELEAEDTCKWQEKNNTIYVQAKYSPCRWIKSIVK
jgi:hypothetical protein